MKKNTRVSQCMNVLRVLLQMDSKDELPWWEEEGRWTEEEEEEERGVGGGDADDS